ncbi:MAG: hypothetical protein MJY47_05540 [Fibrobacter sp.]|nr:hypothetical protein [Fibrobacter sp.]
MNIKSLLAFAACALMFVACGDDVTEVNEIHQDGMAVLEAGLELSKQKCDSANVGEMLFVMDSSEAFICDGESWQTLKGADGKDGEKGADGVKGAKGADGKDGKNGDNGEAGKSAYEIAKENGFEGTEAEWLESMKGPFIQDKRDGKIYKTVKIGDQVWMAENLNYSVKPDEQSWCGGGSDKAEGDCSVYGRLYTWAAAMDSVAAFSNDGKGCGYGAKCDPSGTVRGICPEGWHLPSKDEWNALITAVGGTDVAGKNLKADSDLWTQEDGISNDDSYGFSALPAGDRYYNGSFSYAGYIAFFWSASEDGSNRAYGMNLYCSYEYAGLDDDDKNYAFSVRCLKD